MNLRRISGFLVSGAAAGAIGFLLASSAFAAAPTAGLKSISVQGTGSGALASGDCTVPPIACSVPTTCSCLTGTLTVVGNNGFGGGSLNYALSVDPNGGTVLPVTPTGSCLPATGIATLSNKNGKNVINMNLTGLTCSTVDPLHDVFNGTYTISGGSGKYSSSTTGAGAINGSQAISTGGSTAVATLTGSVQ